MDRKYQDLLFFIEDTDDFETLKKKCVEQRKAWQHEDELKANAKNQAEEVKA